VQNKDEMKSQGNKLWSCERTGLRAEFNEGVLWIRRWIVVFLRHCGSIFLRSCDHAS